ncbi:MAG: hypothetical protein AAF767_00055 [Pseudomonadota bacterium]
MKHSLRALACAMIAPCMTGFGHASEVTASTMKYSNDGAYVARFYIQYKLDDGKACWVKPKSMSAYVGPGGWIKYGLDDEMQVFLGPGRCVDAGRGIPNGIEVWGRVQIDSGSSESCRKDKRVIYQSSGGLMSYKTKGTSFNKNRCRVTHWPAD